MESTSPVNALTCAFALATTKLFFAFLSHIKKCFCQVEYAVLHVYEKRAKHRGINIRPLRYFFNKSQTLKKQCNLIQNE